MKSAAKPTAMRRPLTVLASLAVTGLVLSGCQDNLAGLDTKAHVPVPEKLVRQMKAKNMATNAPIMVRIFKQDNMLEIWKKTRNGRYAMLADYEICKWSGKLGPKFKEGDRQAPEGFYSVTPGLMNPKSQYHLAFNMGFPNAYDRSHGRTGTHLMVHGACSSAGCYAMTDQQVEVIYALARDAFKGGQKAFQIQAFPFRMTEENMVKHRDNEHFAYWEMLKKGNDHFEITKVPPKVDVCEKRYEFNTDSAERYPSSGACPTRKMPRSTALAFAQNQSKSAETFEKLLAKAEKRKPVALAPLTLEQVLPGVTVDQPAPKPAPADAPQTLPVAANTTKAALTDNLSTGSVKTAD